MGKYFLARQFRRLTVGALLSAAMLGQAFAVSEGVPQTIAKKGELTIGLEGTYPPFNYQDASGNLVGFEVDFANELSKRLGLKAKLEPTKWDGILAALGSGRLDVVINQVTITPERQKIYDFSTPYTISGIQIITRPELAEKLTSPGKLAGGRMRRATVSSSARLAWLA
jgi:cystine transport system substrate-binding protein